jgi:hypothetical protein
MELSMNTIHEVEQFAAEHGIILSPADRAKVAAVQESELKRLQAINSTETGTATRIVQSWNQFYPKLLQFIVSSGETLLTFSQTVIVNLGVPIALVMLLIVEHQRVVHGILLFETDETLASFAAAVLVLLNLILEFLIHYLEHKAGYEAERSTRFSLRIAAINFRYWIGWDKKWQERQLSPAERYRRLLHLVTFSILALALAGSMKAVIQQQPGAWYTAIVQIITQSSLSMMLTWLGGLLFAGAAVIGAQGLARYIAVKCVEIISRQQSVSEPFAAALEQAGAVAALAIIQAKLDAKNAKFQLRPVEVAAPIPLQHADSLPVPVVSTNGNGKH